MRRDVTVNVTADPLGITHGQWCPTCALPSALKVDVAITIGSHVGITSWVQCPECHHLWPLHDYTEGVTTMMTPEEPDAPEDDTPDDDE